MNFHLVVLNVQLLAQNRRFALDDVRQAAVAHSELSDPAKLLCSLESPSTRYFSRPLTCVGHIDNSVQSVFARSPFDASVTAMGMSSPEQKVSLVAYVLRSTRGWLIE